MPTNGTHTNGTAASSAPLRDKVQFATNVPQRLTLEFDPPDEPRAGRFGDQYMYFFGGQKIVWFDPPVHAQIVASGAHVGEEIEITKREVKKGNRKHTTWEVVCLNQDYDEAQAEAAAAASIRNQLGDTDPFAPPTHRPPVEVPAKRNGNGWPAPEAPNANPLAQALILAIDAVEIANQYGHDKHQWDEGLALGDETIVKLAITAYIQSQGGKQVRP
jgi:hypothetical protein